jgi:cytoskeletal protein RodZ
MLTVGDILRKAREKQNIKLSDVEKQTRVRTKFLESIENNDWNFFSSKIYITGIIKNYSDYLGLDSKKVLAFFRRDYEKQEEVKFKTRVSLRYLTPETRKVILIMVSLMVLFFGVYFGYQLKLYFSPPNLIILAPQKTTFVIENNIKVVGKTDKEAAVTIFGERVYQDKNGVFVYNFPLKIGTNELVIEIVGANGKKNTIKKIYIKSNQY